MSFNPLYDPPKAIAAYRDFSAFVSDVSGIIRQVKKAFTCQITVPAETKAYQYCLQWLQDNTAISKSNDVVMQKSKFGRDSFVPTSKPFYFTHNGKMLWVRTDKTEKTDGWGSGYTGILIFTCIGRSNKPILDLIDDAERIYKKEEEAFNSFAGHNDKGEWNRWSYRSKRDTDTIILPNNQLEKVLRDIDIFFKSKTRYMELGIPWRRGYLFHGPPGTGKSSIVPIISSKFDLTVYVIQVADVSDSVLATAINDVSPRSIILMEDIDRALESKKKILTQSGLFNAIDGAAAGEGTILIMTTNNRDKLDEALIRPGRIDYEIAFGVLSYDEAVRLYLKFYPGKIAEAKEFARMAKEQNMTPAEAQGKLLVDYDVMDNLPMAV